MTRIIQRRISSLSIRNLIEIWRFLTWQTEIRIRDQTSSTMEEMRAAHFCALSVLQQLRGTEEDPVAKAVPLETAQHIQDVLGLVNKKVVRAIRRV